MTMTSQTTTHLDAATLKRDFPILNQIEPGRPPLAFLDSAASSQKPAAVIEAMDAYYRTTNANIHRGVYTLSERATAQYEAARHLVADFLNARSASECIFVRNTTEAINLVAQSWGRRNLREGDLVLVTTMEHHSNLVPWHLLAEERGIRIEAVPLLKDQTLDLAAYERLLEERPKLVAVAHVSNGLGIINPVAEMIAKAHAVGAVVLVDGAQSAPHLPIDVQALDCDFFALSGHKMLGPMGSGVLFGKADVLEAMPPFMGGGGMIRKVTATRSTYADVPARFEAGTPAVADAIGLGAAVQYLNAVGLEAIQLHEKELLDYAMSQLDGVPGLRQFGPRDLSQRSGVVSFVLDGVHPHDVAAILNEENVAVRAGHHCNQPLMAALGLVATTRASFYLYNTPEDVDRLIAGLHRVSEVFA
jgi:cysteine desulfurase/selenocysteine lyase